MQNQQLITEVSSDGRLTVSLMEAPLSTLLPGQILIDIKAAPVNPSDISFLFAQASLQDVDFTYDKAIPSLSMRIPLTGSHPRRLNKPLCGGYEGSGVIVDVGDGISPDWVGRTVSCAAGGMYARYKVTSFENAIVMPRGVTPRQAASAFVNPMTALAILETVERNGHRALVHTTGSSSVGKMLIKLCKQQGLPLINLVRREAQIAELNNVGASFVLCVRSPSFLSDLTQAISSCGATVCFDAIGGGALLSDVLSCMEKAFLRENPIFSHYGSGIMKQGFIYGHLDPSPLVFHHQIGFSWSLQGWLLSEVLPSFKKDKMMEMQKKIQREILTTFETVYSRCIRLEDLMDPVCIQQIAQLSSGEKTLLLL